MKLRNKETMEIREAEAREDGIYLYDKVSDHWWKYDLDLLARGWEYYIEPKEPLLKDYPNEMEAIRAYGCSPLRFHRHARKGYSTFNFCTHYISFSRLFENLKDGETYSIAELCGEEENESRRDN